MNKKESKQKGWLSLMQESIANSRIETYNPDKFKIEDMEKWLQNTWKQQQIERKQKAKELKYYFDYLESKYTKEELSKMIEENPFRTIL